VESNEAYALNEVPVILTLATLCLITDRVHIGLRVKAIGKFAQPSLSVKTRSSMKGG